MYSEKIREKYPDVILRERMFPEALIISALAEDLTLMEEYNFTAKDFLNQEYSLLYRIFERLRKENYNNVTQLELKSKLSDEEREMFNREGIWRFLSAKDKTSNPENLPNYVDELCKNNIYMRLCDIGVDVEKEIEIKGKKIIPIEAFKNLNSQQVKEFYESYINDFSVLSLEIGIEETEIKFDTNYLDSVLAGETTGVLFDIGGKDINGDDIVAFPTISDESNGFIDGSFSVLAGYSNVGKSTYVVAQTMALVYRGEKVCICSNEQDSKPFRDNFIMWVLVNYFKYNKLTKKKMRLGREGMTEEDITMLGKAMEYWNENFADKIYFIGLPNAKMENVLSKFREYHLKKGCTFFVYDTFKIDFNTKSENFWLGLVRDSRLLQEFANRYKVKVFGTMQCALHTLGQLWLDANVLSNSKQVKEILQNLYIIRNMYQEEKDENSQFWCSPYNVKETSIKGVHTYQNVPYLLDNKKDYKIVFLDKLREGKTSDNGNYAVVLEHNGDTGVMKQVCLCKPVRKNINATQRNTKK